MASPPKTNTPGRERCGSWPRRRRRWWTAVPCPNGRQQRVGRQTAASYVIFEQQTPRSVSRLCLWAAFGTTNNKVVDACRPCLQLGYLLHERALAMPAPDAPGELLVQHKAFLRRAEACIAADVSAAENEQHKAFLSLLSSRLAAHQASLRAVERGQPMAGDSLPWGPIAFAREVDEDEEIVVKVYGPTDGDAHVVPVESMHHAKELVRCAHSRHGHGPAFADTHTPAVCRRPKCSNMTRWCASPSSIPTAATFADQERRAEPSLGPTASRQPSPRSGEPTRSAQSIDRRPRQTRPALPSSSSTTTSAMQRSSSSASLPTTRAFPCGPCMQMGPMAWGQKIDRDRCPMSVGGSKPSSGPYDARTIYQQTTAAASWSRRIPRSINRARRSFSKFFFVCFYCN